MKHALSISALSAALLVAGFATTTDAEAASRRVVRPNAAGGMTSTAAVAHQGATGGGIARGRAVATDGQGNAASVSGGAIRGPNGGTGARVGMNTRSADGSATHQSGMSASGSQGSVQSSSAYNKDTGLTHSATCYNASGAVIACR